MHEPILVINAGSSSIKFSVFETAADRSLSAVVHGQVEGIGTAPCLEVNDLRGDKSPIMPSRPRIMMARLQLFMTGLPGMWAAKQDLPAYQTPDRPWWACLRRARVDRCPRHVRSRGLIPLAPLHEPHNIAAIPAVAANAPNVPQWRALTPHSIVISRQLRSSSRCHAR
jgi:acetate kinase